MYRKSNRKSRKLSRKSSRKSNRKSSRKSNRKSSRKSNRKSNRKSRKSNRKSSRKSNRKSRKSRKSNYDGDWLSKIKGWLTPKFSKKTKMPPKKVGPSTWSTITNWITEKTKKKSPQPKPQPQPQPQHQPETIIDDIFNKFSDSKYSDGLNKSLDILTNNIKDEELKNIYIKYIDDKKTIKYNVTPSLNSLRKKLDTDTDIRELINYKNIIKKHIQNIKNDKLLNIYTEEASSLFKIVDEKLLDISKKEKDQMESLVNPIKNIFNKMKQGYISNEEADSLNNNLYSALVNANKLQVPENNDFYYKEIVKIMKDIADLPQPR
jgi:hypothetical protein